MIPSIRFSRQLASFITVSLAAVLFLTGAVFAQNEYSDYSRDSNYILETGGEKVADAEVYFSQRFPSYLVLTNEFESPVVIVPRSQLVRSVNVMKIAKQDDGSIDLLGNPFLQNVGQFRMQGTNIEFDVAGKTYVFRAKPDLVGSVSVKDLEEYSAGYKTLADSYRPAGNVLNQIKASNKKMVVDVYFGSWCPFCQRYLPRLIRVDRDLGDAVPMTYYGLPKNISSDKRAKDNRIGGVPTAIIRIDGKEVGRIRSDEWRNPERALAEALGIKADS